MLTGTELLGARVKELGDVSKSDLVHGCGYVSTKKDGTVGCAGCAAARTGRHRRCRKLNAVRRQVADNWRHWEQRLRSIDTDLEREPARIRRTFALQTHRVEPAGAICPWPQY